MNPQGRVKLKAWLVLLAVFALGGVSGAALDGLYRARAGAERQIMFGRGAPIFETLRDELNLTDEQATAIRSIVEETRDEMMAHRQRAQARVRAALTPEQQRRFDEIRAQREVMQEWRERRGRPSSSNGGELKQK